MTNDDVSMLCCFYPDFSILYLEIYTIRFPYQTDGGSFVSNSSRMEDLFAVEYNRRNGRDCKLILIATYFL